MFIIPELPEVESVRLSLEPKIVGKTIIDVHVSLDKIIKQQDVDVFIKRVKGMRINQLDRRGKYLIGLVSNPNEAQFIADTLENGDQNFYLIVHLGMTGAWFNVTSINQIDPKFAKHAHATLTLDDNSLLVYCDIRRFGGLRLFNRTEYDSIGAIRNMGPEPFWENAEEIYLSNIKKKAIKKSTPIKEAILDQSIVAGIGNIYASEALYGAKLLPDMPINCMNDEQLIRVFRAARDIMAFSITVGGSSISDYVDGNGKPGQMQNYLKVYGQKECKACGTAIKKEDIGGRSTFYCPECQD